MSVRYIGSKARVVDSLAGFIGTPDCGAGFFVDAFCGTGVVAEAAARNGWSIRLNDSLMSAVAMASARLLSANIVPFHSLGGYLNAIERLNDVRPVEGFVWREYSPASARNCGIARMYFTERNAAKIDGIRRQITYWRETSRLSELEERLLIADLLAAVSRIANTAGTYGCFLSYWTPNSQEDVLLRARELFPNAIKIEASVSDVAALDVAYEDVVYLDPPYTKRQYAAYYHILETLVAGDEPAVQGVTGLRPWKPKASDFCYRARAQNALVNLVNRLGAQRVLLSYSDEGHVALGPLANALSTLGQLTVTPLKEVGRYRPNQAASDAGQSVTEYLLVLDRRVRQSKRPGSHERTEAA